MTTKKTTNSVIAQIATASSSDLDTMDKAISARRKAIEVEAREALSSLKVGDRVRITAATNPTKRLIGMSGEVCYLGGVDVKIILDADATAELRAANLRRFAVRTGPRIIVDRIPYSAIEVI